MVIRATLAFALAAAATLFTACAAFSPSADDLRADAHGHLVWAARTGDIAAIRELAAGGVNLDASAATPRIFVFPDLDHRSWTPLQHAVAKGRVDAVRALLEWGADPDARPAGTWTPLLIAVSGADPTIPRLLLDAGADVNVSRRLLAQPAPGGPLWHVVEHVVERASGRPAPAEALERAVAGEPARR